MSQPSSQFPSALLATLVDLTKQELPPGHPVTFETVEDAVVHLLRKLGPAVMTATLLEDCADPAHPGRGKKGHRRSAPAGS